MLKVVVVLVLVLMSCWGNLNRPESFYDSITFTVYNNLTGGIFLSTFDSNVINQGCDVSGKFAIVTHGWYESKSTAWTADLVSNLLFYRGGCVIFMDYSKYSIVKKYVKLLRKFSKISAVLLKKLRQLSAAGIEDDNLFMYGFSFGARLVIDAGVNFGNNRIKQIDVCEPAGPGFINNDHLIVQLPTLAAKNVQCIHTTTNFGTYIYNCHQDWRMGYCGINQVGALAFPNGSHGFCNQYYNSAFKNDFLVNNYYNCVATKLATQLPENFKMGYMEERRKSSIIGEIFSITSVNKPWTVVDGVINN